MSTFDVIFWGLLLIALIVTTRIATKREKKFAATRDQFIAKHSFIEDGYVYSEISNHGFSLIDKASGNYGDYEATNVLSKLKGTDEFFIFDFRYTPKNSDKSTASKLATIRAVLIKFEDRELPNFELLPENIIEKIKQVFGSSDIDFEKYPDFSKKYVLRSSEPNSLKKTFPERLIQYLESKDGIFIEARKKCLLIYKDEGGEFADYESLYKEAESINNFLR
jgi:hypothetical protein